MMWLAAYLGSVVGATLTVMALVAMRRGEQSHVGRLGWVALVLVAPPVGLILFLIFGGKKVSAEHRDRHPIVLPSVAEDETDVDSKCASFLTRRGLPRPSSANTMRPIHDPVDLERALFDLIDSAQSSLYVMSFILHNDTLGDRLVDRLCEKASQGVQVRLLVDALGSFFLSDRALTRVREAGGDAARFKPLSHLSKFAYINLRNHRKLAVADGQRVLMGGANWVDEELTQRPDQHTWFDLTLSIEGVAAAQAQEVFRSDWEFATGERLPQITPTPCRDTERQATLQIVPGGADSPAQVLDDLWQQAIYSATERLWIATPYFVPPPLAMQSLRVACRRGVDVQILLPDRTDVRIADFARIDVLRELETCGAKIHRYPNRMLHAKVVIVDQEVAFVGSANFDMRSLFLNYELVTAIYDGPSIERVVEVYQRFAVKSLSGTGSDTAWKRLVGTAARLFASEM